MWWITDSLLEGKRMKLSWIADKRGEVVDLRVERDVGIHDRLPEYQLTPSSTSRMFGYLEKSKDRSECSSLYASGDNISVSISRARIGWARRRGGTYASKRS